MGGLTFGTYAGGDDFGFAARFRRFHNSAGPVFASAGPLFSVGSRVSGELVVGFDGVRSGVYLVHVHRLSW
jgi:hypothetical protein